MGSISWLNWTSFVINWVHPGFNLFHLHFVVSFCSVKLLQWVPCCHPMVTSGGKWSISSSEPWLNTVFEEWVQSLCNVWFGVLSVSLACQRIILLWTIAESWQHAMCRLWTHWVDPHHSGWCWHFSHELVALTDTCCICQSILVWFLISFGLEVPWSTWWDNCGSWDDRVEWSQAMLCSHCFRSAIAIFQFGCRRHQLVTHFSAS